MTRAVSAVADEISTYAQYGSGGRLMGHATAMWLGFGEALAALAGALTGLLFVAVSVKSAVLAASRSLSNAWLFLVKVTG